MKLSIIGLFVIVTTLILACSQGNSKRSEQNATEPSTMENVGVSDGSEKVASPESAAESAESYMSSSAAVVNNTDSGRRMIRTADIKFRVKDVIKATYDIENIVVKNNGFVENANLSSEINSSKKTAINADSVLTTTYYTVVNTFVLRVPSSQLDTTLKEIAKFVEFMDYRNVKAVDVSIDLLSKKLEQKRLAGYDDRMKNAIDNKGKKLEDISTAEENLLYKQMQADEAKLANMQTYDKIKYSTISLSLYQNQRIQYEVNPSEKVIQSYEEPYSARFQAAVKFGWSIILEISLFLVNIWSLILIGILAFFGFQYFKRKYNRGE